MGLGIGNIQALSISRTLGVNTRRAGLSLERLSTGYRINHASDDAAGLSISETLIGQIRGYEQSIRNAQDGYNMLSVAEGATSTISENLQRIRELTVQAANDTYSSTERRAIASEVSQRVEDINRVAESAEFNSVQLLDDSVRSVILQIGPNGSSVDTLQLSGALQTATASALGIDDMSIITASSGVAGAVYQSAGAAANFLNTIDSALETLNSRRADIGALQNRLDSVVDNLSTTSMNLASANSRIRDTDIASESSRLVRNQLLQQFDVQLMAQANNQMSNLTLTLLQGI